jgi:hypothetical protein
LVFFFFPLSFLFFLPEQDSKKKPEQKLKRGSSSASFPLNIDDVQVEEIAPVRFLSCCRLFSLAPFYSLVFCISFSFLYLTFLAFHLSSVCFLRVSFRSLFQMKPITSPKRKSVTKSSDAEEEQENVEPSAKKIKLNDVKSSKADSSDKKSEKLVCLFLCFVLMIWSDLLSLL